MLRHLLKLVWKRKARNLMLMLEILLAFVVVFAIAALGARAYQLYHLPLGFAYQDVWTVEIERDDEGGSSDETAAYANLLRAVQALPEVEHAAFATHGPFASTTYTGEYAAVENGRALTSNQLKVSDDFFAASGMQLREGRWFDRSDAAGGAHAVVINRRLAAQLFGAAPALGKTYVSSGERAKAPTRYRVVGVVEDYRAQGEFMAPVDMMFEHLDAGQPGVDARALVLKLRAGTARDFEARLLRQLKLARGDWGYTIAPQSEARASMLKLDLTPLTVLSVIGSFMLVMVAFGLFGVLWQNTTRRIPEIGLRRAIGASAVQIYRQIVAEQLLLSTLAVALALVLLVQLPITGALGEHLDWAVFMPATALSMTVIYLLSLLCAVYPGWRASRLTPTEALHYE